MGLSAEEAKNKVGNRYDLVLIASQRVRELSNGALPKVPGKRSKAVTALKEIEAGKIGREYLKRVGTRFAQKSRRQRQSAL